MNVFKFYKSYILPGLLYIFLFAIIIFSQSSFDKIVNPEIIWDQKTTKYVMPPFILKNFSFGFKNILADYYWINIIQDFAGWDHKDDFYVEEYRNLFTLDPFFSYPYLFGILTVPSERNKNISEVEKFEPIATIGINSLPYNWEIPFYLGTEFHLYKSHDKALHYLEIAASRPIIPDVVMHVYDSYFKKSLSEGQASQAFIKTIYDTTGSETTKKIIREGMLLSQLTQVLKKVVENYKTIYGVYPDSIDDLVSHHMIQVEPALQNEFNVIIDKNTGAVEIKPKTSQ